MPYRQHECVARQFAIVPAAGRSTRMGAPKLLLPIRGRRMIEIVLDTWSASAVSRVIVAVRRDDVELIEHCRRFDVDIVQVDSSTADMKASVLLGLRFVSERYSPSHKDSWLLGPADMPFISLAAIDKVIFHIDPKGKHAVVPMFQGKRGHPVAFPIGWLPQVEALTASEGVNVLLQRNSVIEVACDAGGIIQDIDTPDEYLNATGLSVQTALSQRAVRCTPH